MARWRAGPSELYLEVLRQKDLCSEVLGSKNAMIETLEAEVDDVDRGYADLLRAWHDNTSVLAARIEQDVVNLGDQLEEEVAEMAVVQGKQRRQQMQGGQEVWEGLLGRAVETSERLMAQRLGLVEEEEKEVVRLMMADYMELGQVKEEGEAKMRAVEKPIQLVAAITHLNHERLDYEIHVLNKVRCGGGVRVCAARGGELAGQGGAEEEGAGAAVHGQRTEAAGEGGQGWAKSSR